MAVDVCDCFFTGPIYGFATCCRQCKATCHDPSTPPITSDAFTNALSINVNGVDLNSSLTVDTMYNLHQQVRGPRDCHNMATSRMSRWHCDVETNNIDTSSPSLNISRSHPVKLKRDSNTATQGCVVQMREIRIQTSILYRKAKDCKCVDLRINENTRTWTVLF